ncbi:hypothetical protein BV22DRAFT_1032512 [Leucogyrophana mollusca]|uniref:Uncharacterized protein n=1 Tax=Leucogyrophana mollusca TaxID=85980 RepID=A0ACB8BLN9_9AGAM|nr:hypothetical protein BV22DRAFT_1032512 [Leucogyrophana mollusca]
MDLAQTLQPSPEPAVVDASERQEDIQPQPLSKKGQKKAAKAARMAELKLERRVREREAKKRKRKERAEAEKERKAAGEEDTGEVEVDTRAKRRKLGKISPQNVFNAQVVIDLGFDDMMIEKEIVSLTSQLAYAYSANRYAPKPFSAIIFSSLNARTKARLDGMNDASYRRWAGTKWWEEGYERLWAEKNISDTTEEGSAQDVPAQASVVYLTADSEHELMELSEGETYIIGGICDHNRYKNLCLNKAKASGIRHARLPIGRYIASLTTRKVLTVNQVFEILLKWVESRDWEQAFWSVIPKRKFQGSGANDEVDSKSNADDVSVEDEKTLAPMPKVQDSKPGLSESHSQHPKEEADPSESVSPSAQ